MGPKLKNGMPLTKRNKPWTQTQIATLRKMYLASEPVQSIADACGSTYNAVRKMAYRMGLTRYKNRIFVRKSGRLDGVVKVIHNRDYRPSVPYVRCLLDTRSDKWRMSSIGLDPELRRG